jgi:AraC-like DNA-binding protein
MAGIASALESQGLDAARLLAEVGIDAASLRDVDARFSTEQVSRLWQLAAQRSGNDAIALVKRTAHYSSFEVLGYAMMSAPDLQAGLEHLSRYLRLVTGAATVNLAQGESGTAVYVELAGGDVPVPAARYEYDMLTFLGFCRWVTGRELSPVAVDLMRPAPPDPGRYERAFLGPVRFGASIHCIHLAGADVRRPLPTANAHLAETHARLLGERMERIGDARTAHRVSDIIVKRLADGEPKREEVARALFMSERTLQRRLHDEGTSYHELLDGTRRELAQRYLRQRKMSLAEAAYLLGFADQSAFQRACRRWFGTSPMQYRNRAAEG